MDFLDFKYIKKIKTLFNLMFFFNFIVNPAYLLMNDVNNIKKLDGRMSLSTLLKDVRIPSKRKTEEEDLSQKVN